MLKRYIGDKAFYRHVMGIVIPIIIQNGITNFVSMLDNIMVGQVGTIPMSGVAIVNQLLFVFNLCVFGATSGAGIFTAQFYGSKDNTGIRYTFRFKILVGVLLAAAAIGLFLLAGPQLINLYLKGDGSAADAASTLDYGMAYLKWMLIGLIPFALSNAYSGTLRETGQTLVPMAAGICAIFVNLILNYVLIFGHFGVPAMGVEGAALATVISRFCEFAIVAFWAHTHRKAYPFVQGVYHSFRIPLQLLKNIIIKGMPLLLNEALWSTGMAFLNQCYSTRGLDVVAAFNISSTFSTLANVVFLSMGNAVGIIMGQMLGSGATREKIKEDNRKLLFAAVVSCLAFAVLAVVFSGVFPKLYNTSENVRSVATGIILVNASVMPFMAYLNACYFTMRSGGKTIITFIFDSGFLWCIAAPLAFCLSRFTSIPIVPLYAICMAAECLKSFIGAYVLKTGAWIQNLTQ